MVVLNIQFLCVIFVSALFSIVENKKYEVEQEAMKLYGQNLALVLARFRKTADYLKILTEKTKDLQEELSEVFGQVWDYYQNKLKKELTESFGLNTVTTTEASTSPGFRSLKKKVARRQHVTDASPETQKKIDRIDTYEKLTSVFTVKERCDYKDLGFKYIGDAIHMLIEKMGVEGDEVKMTRMLNGGEPLGLRARTTTEHARDHRVTKEPKTDAPGTADSTEDRTFLR